MADKKYDLAVVYRIYPGVSKTPAIFGDDKLSLSELCLRSFRDSVSGLSVRMWVLFDACPGEYHDLFKKYFSEEDTTFVDLGGVGNAVTFKMQCDLLLGQDCSEYIYFAEDDYFYLPGRFASMLEFMRDNPDAHFVSPYDHMDYYTAELHRYKSEIRFSRHSHWRTASTTCMTFLTTRQMLRNNLGIFLTYTKNNYDGSIWLSMTKLRVFNPVIYLRALIHDWMDFKALGKLWLFGWRRVLFGKKLKLWTPMPSIATHMEKKFLSPAFSWDEVFNEYLHKNQVVSRLK